MFTDGGECSIAHAKTDDKCNTGTVVTDSVYDTHTDMENNTAAFEWKYFAHLFS